MPYAINGFGSAYYGRNEEWPDGSYITTEWFTIAWIPILPLGSYRVRPANKGKGHFFPPGYSQEYYSVRVPLDKKHVIKVYKTESIYVGISSVLLAFYFFLK